MNFDLKRIILYQFKYDFFNKVCKKFRINTTHLIFLKLYFINSNNIYIRYTIYKLTVLKSLIL
jgi:hypothetical protein